MGRREGRERENKAVFGKTNSSQLDGKKIRPNLQKGSEKAFCELSSGRKKSTSSWGLVYKGPET